MKILLSTGYNMAWDPTSPHGGAEEWIKQIATRLAEHNRNQVTVARNPLNLIGEWNGVCWGRSGHWSEQYDVLISVKDFDAIRQVKATKKILVYPQFFVAPSDVNKLVDLHCVMTKAQKDLLVSKGIEEHHIVITPNCYDSESLDYNFALSRDPYQVLFAGATVLKKGIDLMLIAWKQILEYEPKAHLIIVGSQSLWGRANKDIEGFGIHELPERVTYKGFLSKDDVFATMWESGMYVHPSRNDCAPTTVIEAQAAGCYVIASKIGGIPEYMAGGAVFESENLSELVKSLKFYFANIAICQEKAKRGQKIVKEMYRWKDRVWDWRQLIQVSREKRFK